MQDTETLTQHENINSNDKELSESHEAQQAVQNNVEINQQQLEAMQQQQTIEQQLQVHQLQQVDIMTSNLNPNHLVQNELADADEISAQAEILTQIINAAPGITATKWTEDKLSRRTLTTITADTLNTKIVSAPDSNSKFHCDICLKPFVSKRNVQRHMLSHTGEKPWMCEFCFKRFRQKPHLEQHVNIHKGL